VVGLGTVAFLKFVIIDRLFLQDKYIKHAKDLSNMAFKKLQVQSSPGVSGGLVPGPSSGLHSSCI
jgi:hypothetical protein